jgi:hypothetical protein
MKKFLNSILALCMATVAAAELPVLKQVGDKWLLHVDGAPFPILGGQVMNSSSFDPVWMESAFDRMKAFHINTVAAPISWQAVEPGEGKFDFSLVDGLIKQARERDIRLILLWFGTWKNARSFYVPEWVKTDMDRFKRMENADGGRLEVMSNLCEETNAADTHAFVEFMRHLKKVDGAENTVIMVQIQNEVGLLGDTRDRSPLAQSAFQEQVPAQLMDHLVKNKERLTPHLKQVWSLPGYRTKGTWSEVFGSGIEADEIFMAWHYARYIDRMAEAGEAVYNLPMYVNAWIGQLEVGIPGKYPSGGPVARMMDIWKAGAPKIELMAADIYAFYKMRCDEFSREDNPLFVSEACALWLGDRWSAPAKAFYTIAEKQGIGFAPFGIDHEHYGSDHPIGVAYAALENLKPMIVKHFGTENLRGFFKEGEETETSITIGPYQFNITYQPLLEDCYGLIIRTGENEFIFAGNGARIVFAPTNPKDHPGVSISLVEEGSFGADGGFQRKRLVGGDELMGTAGIKLPAHGYDLSHHRNNMSTLRVRLFLHPPRKAGAAQGTDTTPEF